MKIIGAGFGRTGTLSLKTALEDLGFQRCYHMKEVFVRPTHLKVWDAAGQGRPVDWRMLFQDYQATVDWPACAFYKQLMEVYPDAKVLLSVRDPEQWYDSVRETIYTVGKSFPKWARLLIPRVRRFARMTHNIIWGGTFGGRFEDRAHAIDVFNRHNQEVRQHVPPERLLVYQVKDGWGPLCEFLEVAPPKDKPFPHLNDQAHFKQMVEQRLRRTLFRT